MGDIVYLVRIVDVECQSNLFPIKSIWGAQCRAAQGGTCLGAVQTIATQEEIDYGGVLATAQTVW